MRWRAPILVGSHSLGSKESKCRSRLKPFSYLTRVDSETLKSSYESSGPFQPLMCRVSDSGEAVCLCRNGNTETPIIPFTSGVGLWLVADPDAYQKQNTSEKRVTLFIQKDD